MRVTCVKRTVMSRPGFRWVALAVFAIGGGGAAAATLYKHLDKDGRVTYSDRAQPGTLGKVLTIPIDQNTLAPPPPKQPPPAVREETQYEKIIRRKPQEADDSELKGAHRRVESAKQSLQEAQESSRPEDWIYRPKGLAGGH